MSESLEGQRSNNPEIGSFNTKPELSPAFMAAEPSRYTLTEAELATLRAFFTALTADRTMLRLAWVAYRNSALRQQLIDSYMGDMELSKEPDSLIMKFMAFSKVLTLVEHLTGKKTSGSYTFVLGNFIEHGNDVFILARLAKAVKKRRTFPKGSIPNEELVTKLGAYNTDFLRRKSALSMGLNPDQLKSLPALDDANNE